MRDQMDLFEQALGTHHFTLSAAAFVVERNSQGCKVTFDIASLLDEVALEVATIANNLSLTAISHTSADAVHGTDRAAYRDHRVDVIGRPTS